MNPYESILLAQAILGQELFQSPGAQGTQSGPAPAPTPPAPTETQDPLMTLLSGMFKGTEQPPTTEGAEQPPTEEGGNDENESLYDVIAQLGAIASNFGQGQATPPGVGSTVLPGRQLDVFGLAQYLGQKDQPAPGIR